jgi:hypothetical protein
LGLDIGCQFVAAAIARKGKLHFEKVNDFAAVIKIVSGYGNFLCENLME